MNYISYHPHCIVMFKPSIPEVNLVIKFNPFNITEEIPFKNSRSLQTNFTALLGIKKIKDIPFLVVVTQSFPCSTLPGQTIYQVKKIDWIPIVPTDKIHQTIEACYDEFQLISKLFNDGHHYFCDQYRLYQPYHSNTIVEETGNQWKFSTQFIWNQSIMSVSGEHEILKKWCKPIIQGYVDGFQVFLPNKQKIFYNIISRRSNKKAGTRYYARGIDDKGYVANFTETQQIIFIRQIAISNIQIRGSVPVFFEQLGISGLNGQLLISRSQNTTKRAFETHFIKLQPIFDKIVCVNLLSIKKPDQQKLTHFFETLVDNMALPFVKYQYFDFHQQCKNNQFQNSSRLVQKMKQVIDYFDCFVIDTKKQKLIQKQKGVFRANCMDCLDRTNYVQSRIALRVFQNALYRFNPEIKKISLDEGFFVNKYEKSSDILRKFNQVWAENGDSISLHYTGIGSTHTDITKTGKRTFQGTVNHKMRSLMRFFTQFSDTKKHYAIHNLVSDPTASRSSVTLQGPAVDILDAVILSHQIVPSDTIQNQNSFTENYIQKKRPGIVAIGGYIPSESNWFKQWFKGSKQQELQIFIEKKILNVRRLGYQIVAKIQNINSCLLIFGNQFVVRNISQIRNAEVKKHKDSILISKFHVYKASIVFQYSNSSSFDIFRDLLDRSHEEAFQINKLGQAKSSSIRDNNYRTIFGNIGSQNTHSQAQIQDMKFQLQRIKQKRDINAQVSLVRKALDGDEFTKCAVSQCLQNYMESPPVSFIPCKNRILSWNQESMIVKVFEYSQNPRKKCIYGYLGFDMNCFICHRKKQ